MPNYAIQVELQGIPGPEEYELLHGLMGSMGFFATIQGVDSNGRLASFNLPHAMYFGNSVFDCAAVRTQVTSMLKDQIQPDVLVFVVESMSWAMGW